MHPSGPNSLALVPYAIGLTMVHLSGPNWLPDLIGHATECIVHPSGPNSLAVQHTERASLPLSVLTAVHPGGPTSLFHLDVYTRLNAWCTPEVPHASI